MITLKERYYQHIATSTSTINKIVNSNEQPDGTLDNEQTKYVRFIAVDDRAVARVVVESLEKNFRVRPGRTYRPVLPLPCCCLRVL